MWLPTTKMINVFITKWLKIKKVVKILQFTILENLPWEVLGKVTTRIVNEVKGVNRVMYDCTGKPPATIEFEQ